MTNARMKTTTITLSLILALSVAVVAQSTFKFATFASVNSSTAAPKQFTNATLAAKSVTVMGYKSPQTSNTTTVWIGWSSGNGAQEVPLPPGEIIVFKAVDNQKFQNLSNFWFDVTTANDGVVVIYE